MPDASLRIFWRLFLAVFSFGLPFLLPEFLHPGPWLGKATLSVFPQAEPSHKRVGIVTFPATGRQLFQLFDVAPSQDHVIRLKGRDEAFHHIRNARSPFLLAPFFQSSK